MKDNLRYYMFFFSFFQQEMHRGSEIARVGKSSLKTKFHQTKYFRFRSVAEIGSRFVDWPWSLRSNSGFENYWKFPGIRKDLGYWSSQVFGVGKYWKFHLQSTIQNPNLEIVNFRDLEQQKDRWSFAGKKTRMNHWFRMELLQQMTENSDQWTVGASVQNFRFLLRHLRSWRTKKSCLSVEEFWECLE